MMSSRYHIADTFVMFIRFSSLLVGGGVLLISLQVWFNLNPKWSLKCRLHLALLVSVEIVRSSVIPSCSLVMHVEIILFIWFSDLYSGLYSVGFIYDC
jgi:hypothetical protein